MKTQWKKPETAFPILGFFHLFEPRTIHLALSIDNTDTGRMGVSHYNQNLIADIGHWSHKKVPQSIRAEVWSMLLQGGYW